MSILQACYEGNLAKLMKSMKTNGEKPNTIDPEYRRTALSWAIIGGNKEVIKYLLNCQMELALHYPDKDKKIALDHARNCDDEEIFTMLNEFYLHKKFPVLQISEPPRSNCSWNYVRTQLMEVGKQTLIDANLNSTSVSIVSETLHLSLEHRSRKTNNKKWTLHTGKIHHQLRADLRKFNNTDGNMIAVDITFEIKVASEHSRRNITFPLKISNKKIFTMSDANQAMRNTNPMFDAYDLLKIIHSLGTQLTSNDAHGYPIKYDRTSYDKGYAHHSEQALAAYLSTKEAAQMLVNRLRSEMRAINIGDIGTRIKVEAIILHIHSNKTTCGPCENVLIGLQNLRTQDVNNRGNFFGFIEQMEAALLMDQSIYRFYLPTKVRANKQSGLRCYVTFSADGNDTTHKSYPDSKPTSWSDRGTTVLNISTQEKAKKIAIGLFHPETHPFKKGDSETTISDRTIFSSASEENRTTPQKKEKYHNLSNQEFDDLSEVFKTLKF